MRRLRAIGLPLFAGILGVLGARKILRSVGEPLVPLLRQPSAGHASSLLLGVAIGVAALLVARWIWRQTARDRLARILLAATCVIGLAASYVTSGGVTTRGDFHGLLTPEPNSSFTQGGAQGAPIRHEINAHGLRQPSFTIEKPAGTIRIGIVGGSWAFGLGVAQDQTIAATLAARLGERSAGRPLEVLNLGICGDKLPSDVRMIELAHTLLDADATVLLLRLPSELAAPDAQSERRAPFHVDGFSLVSWLLGMQSAGFFWQLGEDERAYSRARLAALDEALAALRAFRREHGERPLLVFSDPPPPDPVRASFTALPGVVLVTPPEGRSDSVPTESALLADALLHALPALRAAP